jgi:hypothetical protein
LTIAYGPAAWFAVLIGAVFSPVLSLFLSRYLFSIPWDIFASEEACGHEFFAAGASLLYGYGVLLFLLYGKSFFSRAAREVLIEYQDQ